MIFTHFGISGPATFVLSAHLAFELIDQRHPYQIRLQCFAHRDHQWRMKALIQASQDHPRQQIKTFLSGLMPDRLAHTLLDSAGVPTTSILTHITRSQRSHLADILGNGLYLTLIARRAGDEFVTAGGILASEIDPLTMQSLVCPNLYLAGEVMDVDGVT